MPRTVRIPDGRQAPDASGFVAFAVRRQACWDSVSLSNAGVSCTRS